MAGVEGEEQGEGLMPLSEEFVHRDRIAKGRATEPQKCKYGDHPATKSILHSEGMAYIPVCDAHLTRGKAAAAACVPFGKPDPSNIDGIREIAKHGDKGKPGYELLHPGIYGGPTYRTPKQSETMERVGKLLQSGKWEEANALVERTQSLTPTQRKMVGSEIRRAKLRAKPKKPKVREIKGMQPATTTVAEVEADAPPMQTAVPVDLRGADGFFPEESDEDDPGAWASRFDTWVGQIQAAQDTDTLTAIEEEIDGMAGPGTPMYDELQDLINAQHRKHFERDRRSVQKWLEKRGIVRKHGNKGAPGYELLHPGTMLKGNRSEKQKMRLERLGAMLQDGDSEGAQALLDRTLNLNDGDRQIAQQQIDAARKGQDGGKSPEAPEHTAGQAQEAPKAPDAPKDTPKTQETPEKPVQDAPKDEEYPADPSEDAQDLRGASAEDQDAYFADVQFSLSLANTEEELDDYAAMYAADLMDDDLRADVDAQIEFSRTAFTQAYGGVRHLPQGGKSNYERAKAAISKSREWIRKQTRKLAFSAKDHRVLTAAEKKRGIENEDRDPADSPAGKHLAAGGSIKDAPADGLWDTIQAFDRFEIESSDEGEGSVSQTHFVTDTATGERFFFKKPLNGAETTNPQTQDIFDPMIYGDGTNEIVAAELGNAAFPGTFLTASWAEDPTAPQPMLRFDHLGDHVEAQGGGELVMRDLYEVDPQTGVVTLEEGTPPLADPKEALALHIYDYVIGNADRHGNNVAHRIDADGNRHLIPIDHGASFHSMVGQVQNSPEDLDQTLLMPETVPYDLWQTEVNFHPAFGAKGRILLAEVQAGYGGDTDRMRADAEEIIATLKKVKTQQIIADLRKRQGSMDAYEQAHLESAILIWENRLEMIRAEDVVTVMGE